MNDKLLTIYSSESALALVPRFSLRKNTIPVRLDQINEVKKMYQRTLCRLSEDQKNT